MPTTPMTVADVIEKIKSGVNQDVANFLRAVKDGMVAGITPKEYLEILQAAAKGEEIEILKTILKDSNALAGILENEKTTKDYAPKLAGVLVDTIKDQKDAFFLEILETEGVIAAIAENNYKEEDYSKKGVAEIFIAAAEFGNIGIMTRLYDEPLFKAIITPETGSPKAGEALEKAVSNGKLEAAKWLLGKSDIFDAIKNHGKEGLFGAVKSACKKGNLDCLNLIIDKPELLEAIIKFTQEDGVWTTLTLLESAANRGHLGCVKALLDKPEILSAMVSHEPNDIAECMNTAIEQTRPDIAMAIYNACQKDDAAKAAIGRVMEKNRNDYPYLAGFLSALTYQSEEQKVAAASPTAVEKAAAVE